MEQNQEVYPRYADYIGNQKFYFVLLIGGIVFPLIGILQSFTATNGDGMTFFAIGGFFWLLELGYWPRLLYLLWRFVINESRRNGLVPSIETPARAVGYCFVPFYNLYWIFQALGKYPIDLNRIAVRKGINRAMSEKLGKTASVLAIVSIIPFIGILAAFANLYVISRFIIEAVDVSKAIGAKSLLTVRDLFYTTVPLLPIVAYLLMSGLEETFVYSRSISEVRQLGGEVAGQSLRIEGTVVPGSVNKSGTSLRCTFALADSFGESIEIRFDGMLPDTFKEGMPAMAEGKYHAGDYFEATNVLTKCPSKYEPAPEEGEAASSSATY